jgi:histidinol phosphatase-like PHP family hydrolase
MSDGNVPLETLVQVAADLGVVVGVADHVSSRNTRLFVSTAERLEEYLSALEAAPVLRSAEICWCDSFAQTIMEELQKRCDYLVGSNHGFPLGDGAQLSPWSTRLPAAWAQRPHEVMEALVRNLCEMVTTLPIQIAAHSTLLPAALFDLEHDVEAWWTEEREDRYIEALLEGGVAIEISNRYRLPHDRFLRKARQAGARFSLGSDGHHLHQVARLEWATAAAERAGVGDDQLFYVDRLPGLPV